MGEFSELRRSNKV